jgi:uncharacterized protein
MAEARGRFVWHELFTPEPEAARRFYEAVVGWRTIEVPIAGQAVPVLASGQGPVGRIDTLPAALAGQGVPPHWLGYAAVPDLEAALAQVRAGGGRVLGEPEAMQEVGRWQRVAGPDGAVLAVFQPAGPPREPADPMAPGQVSWNELLAEDWRAAFDFWAPIFGWSKGEALDLGHMGTYQMIDAGGRTLGAMVNRPPGMDHSAWVYYVSVEAIDAAVERVAAAGGRLVFGPQSVPGGLWIVNGMDPQGAHFALVGPRQPAG